MFPIGYILHNCWYWFSLQSNTPVVIVLGLFRKKKRKKKGGGALRSANQDHLSIINHLSRSLHVTSSPAQHISLFHTFLCICFMLFVFVCPVGVCFTHLCVYLSCRCQTTKPICQPNPCQNGGQCVSLENVRYRCDCPSGYDGPLCQNNIGMKLSPVWVCFGSVWD